MVGECECEFHYPEPIIQHVQSFLSSKEAAQTTTLSKSWGGAWLTRPNLDFDQTDLGEYWNYKVEPFLEFANKTMSRYENSNLKIDSLRLCLSMTHEYSFSYERAHKFIVREKLILRALKFGAARLSFDFIMSLDYVLPNEVLGSENLVALTVKGCLMDRTPKQLVRCTRLQSLCLDVVRIKNIDMVASIISSCPLIERLSLSNIKEYDDDDDDDGGGGGGDDGVINIFLHRLRSLVLKYVYFDTLFLGDLSSQFPCLKDLTLCMSSNTGPKELLISSCSLERLDFTIGKNSWWVKFDVPNIRKFTYEGSAIPSLSFRSTSRRWVSHVSIKRHKCPSASWFLRLSKFLTKLRRSRIHLSLHVYSGKSFDYKAGRIPLLPALEIENLTINFEGLPSLSCYALLDGLFRMCPPKWITLSTSSPVKTKHIKLLTLTLSQGLVAKLSTPINFMYGLNDLKEARAQVFDESVSTWRDAPLDSLLIKDSKTREDNRKIRFLLNWQSQQLN